jgi:hypothetical protein
VVTAPAAGHKSGDTDASKEKIRKGKQKVEDDFHGKEV